MRFERDFLATLCSCAETTIARIDTLIGNIENDSLEGGLGNDVHFDGDGSDTFVFNFGDGSDVIEDNGGGDTDVLDINGF